MVPNKKLSKVVSKTESKSKNGSQDSKETYENITSMKLYTLKESENEVF